MGRRSARPVPLRPLRQEGALFHRRNSRKRRRGGDRKTALIALVFIGSAILSAQSLIFTHVNVIDATGAPPHKDISVEIAGGRIKTVHKNIRPPRGARVIDAKGKFLIPGLWDMHV